MAFTEVNVYVHPSKWSGGPLPEDIRNALVQEYNAPGKIQRISTQPPIVTITTYDPV